MSFPVWLFRAGLAGLLLVNLTGCLPSGQSDLDEEKEPHFIAGRKSVNSMDYQGAIEEFEKALEVDPHNGRAHFQLGWLYEEKEPDPAAAIYHYQKFLKLRPKSENAEVVRQRITNCKQDLAKTVLPLPITPGMQRRIDEVMNENKQLKEENERWRAYVTSRAPTSTNAPTLTTVSSRNSPSLSSNTPNYSGVANGNSGTRLATRYSRTHTVQTGETLSSISRKYNIKLDSLISANPGLEPKRMRVGQTLNVPNT